MIDGIIKADGTSRLMSATLPATYEEFRAQCAAGTQPLDILFNALGWSQLPTFLNKKNLLKDTTAEMFGKGVNAVPDDIFKLLGKYNLHWWSKTGVNYAFNLGDSKNVWLTYSTFNAVTIYYADEVSVDESGNVVLVSPVSLSIDLSPPSVNSAQVIKGRYFIPYYNNTTSPRKVYFCPASATVVYAMESDSGIRVNGAQRVTATPSYSTIYVNSSDRNAYPDSGTEGEYIYEYLGIPFQNAVTAPQIATGSYTGTGTYTSAGAVSIPVGFAPKIVFVYNTGFTGGNTDVLQLVMMGEMYSIVGHKNDVSIVSGTGNNENIGKITEWGDTVSFWANSGTYFPNKSGLIYKWFAIG